jgi:molybdopterin-guanine dinucleotide biosynthesis protein
MRIVVGGETRKAGKTTVVCRIVAAFPDAEWTVVKMTPHMHGGEGAWALEEDEAGGDTRRYREAGARRTLLYRGDVEAGLGQLMEELGRARNWIVETTSAARLMEHDLAILVTAAEGAEVKEAAGGFPEACVRLRADDGALESAVSDGWKA